MDNNTILIINFSHPLTPEQREQVGAIVGGTCEVLDIPVQFDHNQPFVDQLDALMERVPLSPHDWQRRAIILNLPALSSIAGLVIAEVHGRMGYFPPILRLRAVANSLPPKYEVAEVLSLMQVRHKARTKR
jgi:hypothetical protein